MLVFNMLGMASTTTTKKFNTFISRPLQDSSIRDIPGVGTCSLTKLLEMNIDSPEKLMGMYLMSNRDRQKMKNWIISSCSIRAQEAEKITNAIEKKSEPMMKVY